MRRALVFFGLMLGAVLSLGFVHTAVALGAGPKVACVPGQPGCTTPSPKPPTPTPAPTATPTPAPTPTPTPAAPLAQAATQAQLSALAAFEPAAPPAGSWKINESAVAGQWALVGFCNANSGWTGLFQVNSSGTWSKIVLGGGQMGASDLQAQVPSMPAATAQSLYSLAVSQDTGC